jgi:hypothetical protein
MRQRDQGEGGAHGEGRWRQGRAGWTGLGQAGPGCVTSQIKTHDTHNHQSESDCELKSETGRDKHATNHDIRQRNMLQHDATPMTLRFCLYMTWTPVAILL